MILFDLHHAREKPVADEQDHPRRRQRQQGRDQHRLPFEGNNETQP
jgi:hypothetical protein